MTNRIGAALAFAVLAAGPACAREAKAAAEAQEAPCHEPATGGAHAGGAAPLPAAVAARLPAVSLLDQRGEPVQFPADLAGDGVVIMDFVYTSCSTVCPVLSALFWSVQEALGERLGRDVRLVSLTIDPARDTPAALQAYAGRLGARPGWTWLTGGKEQVDRVLKALGVWTADPAAHAPVVMVGSVREGKWVRLNGFPSREQILAAVASIEGGRAKAAQAEGRP